MSGTERSIQIGAWRVDPAREQISKDGETIKLERRLMQLLLCLAEHPGQVISVDQLLDTVWAGVVVTPDSVYHTVAALRRILGDNKKTPVYITNTPRRGYCLIAPVVRDSIGRAVDGFIGELAPTPEAAVPERSRSRLIFIVVFATLFLALGYAAIKRPAPNKPDVAKTSAPEMPTAPSAGSPVPVRSIAVLPFLDMSESKDQEYFADGMTEAIIDLLAKIPELRVPARTSSFYFKGKSATVSEIGRELKVAHVLEGSIRKSGNRLKITAQLIRTDDGYHIWSETYDRNPNDIFDVQDEIAAQVVQAMQLRLLDSSSARRRTTPDAEAYGLLLQGRFFGRRNNQQDRERSIDLYRRAIEIDPSYALAWAWLSTGYTVQALSGWSPQAVTYARAREAAMRAIDLDPELADGHSALGQVLESCDWDWAGAKAEYERARALDPHNVRVLNLNAHIAMDEGRLEDAIHLYREATISDPLSPGAQDGLAGSLWADGRLADAELVYGHQSPLSESDSSAWLGLLMIERGENSGLEEIARDHNEAARLTALSMANYRLARKSESDEALTELIHKYPNLPAKVAQIHAYRGEIDEAYKWTDKAFAAHDKDLIWVKVHVGLRNLPHDERWAGLLRKMKLPE